VRLLKTKSVHAWIWTKMIALVHRSLGDSVLVVLESVNDYITDYLRDVRNFRLPSVKIIVK